MHPQINLSKLGKCLICSVLPLSSNENRNSEQREISASVFLPFVLIIFIALEKYSDEKLAKDMERMALFTSLNVRMTDQTLLIAR